MPASQYLKSGIENQIKGTALTWPTTFYVALYTTAPTDADASGVECTGTGYARVAVADTGWSAVTTGTPTKITNAAKVDFGLAGGANWGTLVAFAIYDALTLGHEWFYNTLTANKVINNGDAVYFDIGALEVDVS